LQLGVLGDDNEWEITIQEAYASTTSAELRLLAELANRLLMEERNYNREALLQEKNDSLPKLNAE
nr:DNA helicase [Tanacetum cinerariifolium]